MLPEAAEASSWEFAFRRDPAGTAENRNTPDHHGMFAEAIIVPGSIRPDFSITLSHFLKTSYLLADFLGHRFPGMAAVFGRSLLPRTRADLVGFPQVC